MTYACSCGWSILLENGVEHKDIFLNHFHNNEDTHRISSTEHEENINED